MTKVKIELTILQANCLAQLAEEADIETFASSGHSPARGKNDRRGNAGN